MTPHALRRSYITFGLQQGVPLREMQRAARHTKADTTIADDQWVRSFHRDPTFVLMSANRAVALTTQPLPEDSDSAHPPHPTRIPSPA